MHSGKLNSTQLNSTVQFSSVYCCALNRRRPATIRRQSWWSSQVLHHRGTLVDQSVSAMSVIGRKPATSCDDWRRPSGNQVSTSLGNSGLCWTVFARNRDTAVPSEGNGDLRTLICVLVARPRRCLTLSNPFPWQNWMAAHLGCTLRMRTLFRGWPIMVNDTHTRRRRSSSWLSRTCDGRRSSSPVQCTAENWTELDWTIQFSWVQFSFPMCIGL